MFTLDEINELREDPTKLAEELTSVEKELLMTLGIPREEFLERLRAGTLTETKAVQHWLSLYSALNE